MRKPVGSKVKMTADAVENYGKEYAGKTLTITHAANKYMPASQFYAQGKPEGYHPGYDEGAGGWLYDFSEINFSLYSHELQGN